jgi:hypothetical protein
MTNSIIDDVTQKAWELDVGDNSRPPAVTRERYTWWVQHVFRAAEELGYTIEKQARPSSAELFDQVRDEVMAEREQNEAKLAGTYPHGLGNDGEPF